MYSLPPSYRPSSDEERDEFVNLKKKVVVRKEELRCMLSALPRENGYV